VLGSPKHQCFCQGKPKGKRLHYTRSGGLPKLLTAAAELFVELRYGHSERPFTVVECGWLADISLVINQVLKLPR